VKTSADRVKRLVCSDYKLCKGIPQINNTLDTLAGTNWFSTLDLESGYWQVHVHTNKIGENCILDWSRFVAVYSHAFGLCNAPATYKKLMETVLQGLTYDSCLVCLDDVTIVVCTFQEHLINL
jgi:hypothetical protein